MVLNASGHHFGGLFVTLGVPGLPWASPWVSLGHFGRPLEVRWDFVSVFGGFGAPPGGTLWDKLVCFCGLWRKSARSGCGPLLLMPFGWKKEPGAAAL